MKHRTALALLLAMPVMTGCREQDPAGAGGNTAPAARIPEGLDERHAANFLAAARDFQKEGNSAQAIATLNDLLSSYPKTEAAEEAKQMLAELQDDTEKGETEDGGVVPSPDRDRAQKFLAELPKVKSTEEEKRLLTEFGAWLRAHDYNVEVRITDGKSRLSCPHFPPETPWIDHSFLDDSNLELLPRLNEN